MAFHLHICILKSIKIHNLNRTYIINIYFILQFNLKKPNYLLIYLTTFTDYNSFVFHKITSSSVI